MIELYQLHWSHYVEKVRWALDYKGLPWRGIEIVVFSQKEMKRFSGKRLVPLIYDDHTGVAMSDSSPIIRYLDETYPDRPLFPKEDALRAEAYQWMLRLDSTLGLGARRLGYTQIILEQPQILPRLFLPRVWGGIFTWPVLRSVATPLLGMMLTLLFRLHQNREDRTYERLEQGLTSIAQHIEREGYLVGRQFTAADLTLAALLRPLRIVPYFRTHSRLQSLFIWQEDLFRQHNREALFLYESVIAAVRRRRGYTIGDVPWLRSRVPALEEQQIPAPAMQAAFNDQQPLSARRWLFAPGPYVQLRWFSGIGKLKSS